MTSQPNIGARARAALGAVPRLVAKLAEGIGALGIGAFGWPLAMGVGIGTGLFMLVEPRYLRGVLKHRATMEWMHQTLEAVAISVMVVAFAASAIALIRRVRDERPFGEHYRLTLSRGAVLTALPLVVACTQPFEPSHDWIILVFALATGLLAAHSAYAWVSDAPPRADLGGIRGKIAPAIVLVAMVAYACATSYLSITNHLSFNTGRADLGIYMSVFRQSSLGIPLGCSLCGGNHVTGHFDPIIVLLSPIYLLYPFAETILVLQSVWLAAGAIPVYLLSRHLLGYRGVSVALALTYLAYPALHGVNLFDFHSLALAGPLFLFLLYFLERERVVPYYVTLALLLLVREDISIALCLVGISSVFSRIPLRARLGFVTIGVSAVYFVIAKAVFMGHIDPLNAVPGATKGYSISFDDLIPPGKSTAALLGTVIGDPVYTLTRILTEEKIDYLAKLGVPLLGLPLLVRGRVMLLYGAALTLLASAPFLHSIHFQYSTVFIPFLFALTIAALGDVRTGKLRLGTLTGPRFARSLAMGVFVTTLVCSYKFGALLPNNSFEGGFRPLRRTLDANQLAMDGWIRKFALSVPRNAKVAANSRLLTHLGCVKDVYLIDDRQKADYVLVDMKNRPLAKEVLRDAAAGHLVQIDGRADIRVYRTNYPKPGSGPPTPPSKSLNDE